MESAQGWTGSRGGKGSLKSEDGVCAGVDWIKRRKRITEIMSSHNDNCNGEMTVMQQKNLKSGTAGSCSLIA